MEIFCNVDMFTAQHNVYAVTPDGKQRWVAFSDMDHLPQTLLAACTEHKLHKIHLAGIAEYVNILIPRIKSIPDYSINNIEIEVN